MSTLRDCITGTRVAIGDRIFEKVAHGTFWREDLGAQADRVVELPVVTLEAIEEQTGAAHVVCSQLIGTNQ